jgi:uncharacterized protein YcbK (DUF882 family)
LPSRYIRLASSTCLAAVLLLGAALQTAKAAGETRTISFYNTHTKEDLTITYKVNGRYDQEALRKIDYFMRDWRQNKPTRMDPELIDLLWEVHRETGAREPISVVCGYRSPETNAMLRKRSRGVARTSQHMLGKAIDFYISGVSTDELRAAGMRAQVGGVGFYGNSSFVHMDTGSVRHWPRLPEAQVARIMAKGQLASRNASDASTRRVNVAEANGTRSGPSFFSKVFGGGDDHESKPEAAATQAAAPAAPKPSAVAARASDKPAVVAAAPEPRREKAVAVPMPQAKPAKAETYQVASAGSVPVKLQGQGYQVASAASTPIRADSVAPLRPAQDAGIVGHPSLSANDIINDRGYWQGLPTADAADAGQTAVSRTSPAPRRAERVAAANLAPWPLVDRGNDRAPGVGALGYAPQSTQAAAGSRLAAGNANLPTDVRNELAAPVTVRKGPEVAQVGDRFNDPWMRAMMVSPSAQRFLKTTLYGVQDFRTLSPLLAKPAMVVSARFADDPMNGMSTEKFGGSAVAFIPTVNLMPRTAALR